jgi:hypothetical protein
MDDFRCAFPHSFLHLVKHRLHVIAMVYCAYGGEKLPKPPYRPERAALFPWPHEEKEALIRHTGAKLSSGISHIVTRLEHDRTGRDIALVRLIDEDFRAFKPGYFPSDMSAIGEYHYAP